MFQQSRVMFGTTLLLAKATEPACPHSSALAVYCPQLLPVSLKPFRTQLKLPILMESWDETYLVHFDEESHVVQVGFELVM